MAYESRLYVVDKSDMGHDENGKKMFFGREIAKFNLCAVPRVSAEMCKYKETDTYIFSDDGNTEIVEDMFGDKLKEIPIEDAIRILEDAQNSDTRYRRYAPCIAMLKGFDKSEWKNLVVLHYGY